MLTRYDAIEILTDLINSGIFSDEIEEGLEDIRSCIEAELLGRHEWGVDREKLAPMYVSVREDLITDEMIREYDRTHKSLTFIPSVDERIVIESAIVEEIENSTGEEATPEDVEKWFERL